MADPETPKGKRPPKPTRRGDSRTLTKFVEELSWLMSSYEDLDFRALGELASDLRRTDRAALTLHERVSSKRMPAANFLVGVLPKLFTDVKLFPTNEDIVEFAQSILTINLTRWEKKSRYELIGLIVCQTEKSTEHKIDLLIQALAAMVDERSSARSAVANQRRAGASWNEVIQRLISES